MITGNKRYEKLERQIQIQSMMMGVVNHDIRSPLKYLRESSKRVFELSEKEFPEYPYLNTVKMISETADQVLDLADDLLKLVKLTLGCSDIQFEEFDIKESLCSKLSIFDEIARNNDTEIVVKGPRKAFVTTNRQMLEIIVHNLIDNAIKSSYKDKIVVSVQNHVLFGQTSITIEDTADGMAEEVVAWLNDQTGNNDSITPDLPGIGFGLVLIKEFTRMLKISIIAKSSAFGTSIRLLIPTDYQNEIG